jgi:hypothetical protein
MMVVGGLAGGGPMEFCANTDRVLGGILLAGFLIPAARTVPRARLALAFSIVPLALAFVPWLATPLFHRASYMVLRVLLNAPAIPAAVLVLAWSVIQARHRGTLRRLVTAGAVALWALAFVAPALRAFAADARRATATRGHADPCASALVDWARGLPIGSTILSDPATSYVLSACTPHRFVALYEQHANPYDPYALDRLRAARDAPPYAVADLPAACERYRVDYVVVNRGGDPDATGLLSSWSPSLFEPAVARIESMSASFQRVFQHAGVAAFRFQPGAAVQQHPPAGPVPPVGYGSAGMTPCDVPVPGDAFRLTGVSLSPAQVLPGDTVVVSLGYRRDLPGAFGFPFLVHIRFDHSTVPRARRYPGEKYVRRGAERWSGSFVRFRADLTPGHGVFEPDLWPIGVDLCERFVVTVPRAMRPGAPRGGERRAESLLRTPPR